MMSNLINGQALDAVIDANLAVVSMAPAITSGLMNQTLAHAASLAMQNAVQAQAGLQQINNAAIAALIGSIDRIGP